MHIGIRLSKARIIKGISVTQLAIKLKVTPDFIRKIEDGRIDPTFGTVNRFMTALHVDFEHLFSLNPSEEKMKTVHMKVEMDNYFKQLDNLIRNVEGIVEETKKEEPELDINKLQEYISYHSNLKYFQGYLEGLHKAYNTKTNK